MPMQHLDWSPEKHGCHLQEVERPNSAYLLFYDRITGAGEMSPAQVLHVLPFP